MGKLNSSPQDREGKTPYDPAILTKPMIHQDRDISIAREKEKDREGKTPHDPTILTKAAIHQDCDISRTRERERLNT